MEMLIMALISVGSLLFSTIQYENSKRDAEVQYQRSLNDSKKISDQAMIESYTASALSAGFSPQELQILKGKFENPADFANAIAEESWKRQQAKSTEQEIKNQEVLAANSEESYDRMEKANDAALRQYNANRFGTTQKMSKTYRR